MDYDSRDMLVSSDYPLDKVIGMMSGSRNVPPFDLTVTDHSHGFGFTPLALTMYSFDSSFNSAMDEGIQQYGDPNDLVGVTSHTDSSNLKLQWISNIASSRTVYWRTYFFMPSNVSEEVAFTSIDSDEFVLNTDYNYTKLFMAGTGSGNFSVNHNLGYLPQVIAWRQGGLGLSRITEGNISAGQPELRVTTNSLLFNVSGTAHYRIYIDE